MNEWSLNASLSLSLNVCGSCPFQLPWQHADGNGMPPCSGGHTLSQVSLEMFYYWPSLILAFNLCNFFRFHIFLLSAEWKSCCRYPSSGHVRLKLNNLLALNWLKTLKLIVNDKYRIGVYENKLPNRQQCNVSVQICNVFYNSYMGNCTHYRISTLISTLIVQSF